MVSSSLLMMLFAAIMLVVGSLMLRGRKPAKAAKAQCSPYWCIPIGFGVGLVTGFLGVGGGFLIVPALLWFVGLDARKAIGTSLGIIAVNSAAGLAGHMRYAHWDWQLTGEFVMCSLLGMALGIPIASRAPEQALRKTFAVVVLAVAVSIVWQVLARR